jgi:ribosomal protein L14
VDTVHVVLSTKDNCKRLDTTIVNFDLNTLTMCSKKIILKGGTKETVIIRQ